MYNQVQLIKDALATKDVVPHLTQYLVKNGYLHASDGRVTAATPVDFDGEFLVPGKEFEKVLEKLKGDVKLTLKQDKVVLQNGRLRGSILIDVVKEVSYEEPTGNKIEVNESLIPALYRIRNFVSTNAVHLWSICICADGKYLFATNNVVLAYTELKGIEFNRVLLPVWAIDFIMRQSNIPSYILDNENYLGFVWPDGSWMKAQKVAEWFPEMVWEFMDRIKTQKISVVTNEWKEAYKPVGETSEQEVRIYKDRIVGFNGAAEIESLVDSPIPKGYEYSIWDPKFLNPVIEVATHWDPSGWPNPTPFYGHNIKGFIIGRQSL